MIKRLLFVIVLIIPFVVNASSELPKLYFYGNVKNMEEKSDERKIEVKYVSEDKSFDSFAKIRVQGASSLRYDKKNFNITFYEDNTYVNKRKIDVKWGEMSKYTLKANWLDKTHSRNLVSADIYADIQKKYGLFDNTLNNGVVDGFPIEIYVNDKFYGLYTLNLHKDYFFDLDEDNPNNILFASKASTLVTNFRMETDTSWYNFEVEVGEETQESVDKLNRLINFVMNSSDEEFVEHFDEYLNLDAMLNYYCFMMLAELVDNADNNIFLVTYDGKIWYPSMYDMDIAWGSSNLGETIPYDLDMGFARKGSLLWKRFEQNFGDYIVVRYFELREEIFTEEYITNKFYSFYNNIPEESLLKEQKKWKEIPGLEIKQIEEFLKVRIPFMDSEIEKLKTENYDKVYESFYYKNKDVSSFDYEFDSSVIIMFLVIMFLLIVVFFGGALSRKVF